MHWVGSGGNSPPPPPSLLKWVFQSICDIVSKLPKGFSLVHSQKTVGSPTPLFENAGFSADWLTAQQIEEIRWIIIPHKNPTSPQINQWETGYHSFEVSGNLILVSYVTAVFYIDFFPQLIIYHLFYLSSTLYIVCVCLPVFIICIFNDGPLKIIWIWHQ